MTTMRPPTQVPLMMPPGGQPPQLRGPPPTSQPLPLGALGVTRPPVNLSAPPPNLPQVQMNSEFALDFFTNPDFIVKFVTQAIVAYTQTFCSMFFHRICDLSTINA